MASGLICAVVAPYEGIYSETFIRDHITRLPPPVIPLYGVRWNLRHQGRPVLSRVLGMAMTELGRRYLSPKLIQIAERQADARLSHFWQRHNVKVILAEYANTAGCLINSARQARVPLVVHCHGYDVYAEEVLQENRGTYSELFKNAAAFIAVSLEMVEQLVSLGAPRERIFYNPCGVDTAQFNPTNPGSNPPTVVTVGRFVDKKAPYATLLAFNLALNSCPEARLIMVGDGPLLAACKQMAQALGLTDRVLFLGRQEPQQVQALLQEARVFALHSVRALNGDSEGTPVSILEAAATGLPVIATQHCGMKDVVLDGVTGYLVPQLDIHAMAERMSRVLNDPHLAQTLGEASRKRVVQHYSMERSIGRVHEILMQASKDHAITSN